MKVCPRCHRFESSAVNAVALMWVGAVAALLGVGLVARHLWNECSPHLT